MKYSDILAKYDMIAVRLPRRGESFITRPNHIESDDEYYVVKADHRYKYLSFQIVKLKKGESSNVK